MLAQLRKQDREDPLLLLLILHHVVAPVHKDILGTRVTVEVAIEVDVSGLEGLLDHLLHSKHLREQSPSRLDPLPIQVIPRKAAPVVSDNDSIWVEHWNYLEDEAFSELLRPLLISHQVVDKSFHYK